jgi:uncharacterized protein (DUF952 family)
MTNLIYKIEDARVWAGAEAAGTYLGSPLDLSDGFIHLSAPDQVRETAGKWFAGRAGLVLIGVDPQSFGDSLKWEASRGGALFPHIYGPLPMGAVVSKELLALDENGLHIFGANIA